MIYFDIEAFEEHDGRGLFWWTAFIGVFSSSTGVYVGARSVDLERRDHVVLRGGRDSSAAAHVSAKRDLTLFLMFAFPPL
jgi:hypothetical protein